MTTRPSRIGRNDVVNTDGAAVSLNSVIDGVHSPQADVGTTMYDYRLDFNYEGEDI